MKSSKNFRIIACFRKAGNKIYDEIKIFDAKQHQSYHVAILFYKFYSHEF